MKTFKHLDFKPHSNVKDGVHSILNFDNGTYISVVGGPSFLYGNGTTSFEIMSTITDKQNTVNGWLSKKQVTSRMRYLQSLPKIQ
tara:strand:+ start:661 stop:915 length:255 start_codon:yes stop_codon:yes gene_type:complete